LKDELQSVLSSYSLRMTIATYIKV